jgi:hypothetical protein
MVQMRLFDQHTIDQLEWPKTHEAELTRAHLLPMIKEGVQKYIRNVDTQLYLLQINKTLVPITVNSREYNNSYLTSNYFPIKYLEEQLTKKKSFLSHVQKPFIKGVGLLLKGIKINKVVIVNNWLMTTNIYPTLSDLEIKALTAHLVKQFPDHILIFRSLNTLKCSQLAQNLEEQHFRLLFARNVCIYDPEQKIHFSSKVFYHHRRDRRLISEEGYEIVRFDKIGSDEIDKLLQLYHELYLKRHTHYSPHYTVAFLKEAVEKRILQLVGLKKEGEIKGVIGFYERKETLIAPFCGYDQTKEDAGHLYRMLTILAIDEAEKRNIILNDGSGGASPKQYRGMKSFPEYIALYDRHLPCHRRFFWAVAEKMMKRLALDKINKPNDA